jgi:Asp-tRNA(Asn)/Glu-tRNA(Gln) amidotransferase A subunit family amidase
VEDLTLAMRVLLGGGPEMALPTYPLVPLGDPGEVPIEGLRVAWFDDDGFIRPAPAIRRAVREAVAALEARGHRKPEEDTKCSAPTFCGTARGHRGPVGKTHSLPRRRPQPK